MRALVTGATGKVGHATARTLIAEGHDARALVRDPERARGVVPDGVELAQGDVTDPASVVRAAAGCELVFNAMGLPEQWLADAGAVARVNIEGTRTVVEAARSAGAGGSSTPARSTCFTPSRTEASTSRSWPTTPKGTPYERSKQEAERVALAGGGREPRGRRGEPRRGLRARARGQRLGRARPLPPGSQRGGCRS